MPGATTQQTTDPNEQSASSGQGNQNEQNNEGSQQPPTPPTENQAGQATESQLINGRTPEQHSAYISTLEAIVREQATALNKATDQISRQTTPEVTPAAPQKTDAEWQQDFYQKPHVVTREIIKEELNPIRQELKASVDELVQFVRGQRGEGTPFTAAINRLKADARFTTAITPDIEAATQEIINRNRAEINDQNVAAAVIQAIGLKAVGALAQAAPIAATTQHNPSPNQPSVTNPPHLRPSAAPGPRQQNTPADEMKRKVSAMTEAERRLSREQFKGKDEDYITWRDHGGSDSVSFSSYITGSGAAG